TRLLASLPTRRSSDLNSAYNLLGEDPVASPNTHIWPVFCFSLINSAILAAAALEAISEDSKITVFACSNRFSKLVALSISLLIRSEEHTSELQSRENL